MSAGRPLRIALLCHSVNPRGGVVHTFELAAALQTLGHEPVLHAPDPGGRGFFRAASFETVSVTAGPAPRDTTAMVERRIADYLGHFDSAAARRFDVFHAQDGISGNALATLKARGLIGGFGRTVHHLDDYACPRLDALQTRSIAAADGHFVVSRTWAWTLGDRFGIEATLVGNGVDLSRFGPKPDGREAGLRARFGLGNGPVVLGVGGVEARKNARGALQAFRRLKRAHPHAQLVLAGGASLLDHDAYRAAFEQDLRASGLGAADVVLTGPLADEDMAPLYRVADLLAFPSLREGFGLVVLEAMASGVPAVVSRVAPFTEYLADDESAWCDPADPGSIADALEAALAEPLRSRLVARGAAAAARHSWDAVARAHLPAYHRLAELAYA